MTRFLLVGLDGAEPSLVETWMDHGCLPNLDRLRRAGSYLPLASTMPPASFPAWTTCVTGVNPGRHGIFDFTEIAPGPARAVRFVNSTFRKSPALWNTLSCAGKRVCVLGVPATYPPEPVNGCMVSGFDSPVCGRVDKSFVYPADLYGEISGWRYSDLDETRIGPGWHEAALPRILKKIEDKERIALKLIAREDWGFFMAVFGESDAVAHHFWLFHDPQSPRHIRSALSGAVRQVYTRLDSAVGALINAAGPGAVVSVVSDHGSGGAGTGVIHLNNWLAEHGYLRFSLAHARVRDDSGGWAKRTAMALVPHRMRGALFRRFTGMAAAAEAGARFRGIDWANTRAWSEELNYFPSIRVCGLAGHGYASFCNDLCAKLEAWEPVKKAWRREQIYHGPYVERAPDIVLELDLENGYSYSCLRSRGGPPFRRLDPAGYYGGKGQALAGNHRPTGVCFLSQPITAGAAAIQDIAPTVLACLDVPAPPMDGTPLLGALRETGGAEHAGPEAPYTPEQQRAVEQRLHALGYFE
ncbi:MAG: alkaline phosphatase family protein [Candidatus Hydrogenedentes bacterium]|nr:alkaline phosphatase family protein [Candidatus Hydrogenedentota bacterium]